MWDDGQFVVGGLVGLGAEVEVEEAEFELFKEVFVINAPVDVAVGVDAVGGEVCVVEVVVKSTEEYTEECFGTVELEDAVVDDVVERETVDVGIEVFVESKGKCAVAEMKFGDKEAEVMVVDAPYGVGYGVDRVEVYGAVVVAIGEVEVADAHVAPRGFGFEADVVVQVGVDGEFEARKALFVDAEVKEK